MLSFLLCDLVAASLLRVASVKSYLRIELVLCSRLAFDTSLKAFLEEVSKLMQRMRHRRMNSIEVTVREERDRQHPVHERYLFRPFL